MSSDAGAYSQYNSCNVSKLDEPEDYQEGVIIPDVMTISELTLSIGNTGINNKVASIGARLPNKEGSV